jgi:fructose transport system ATP-binding protein
MAAKGLVMTGGAATPVLEARGLVKRYGRVTALDGADFDLMPGEILAVIGDNGAGKSTLIKALTGAVIPDHGEILLNGEPARFRNPLDARDAGIETVYQGLALAPSLSVVDNLFLGRERRSPSILGRWFRKLDRSAMQAACSPSRTSISRSKRSPAASARASPSRAPPCSAAAC